MKGHGVYVVIQGAAAELIDSGKALAALEKVIKVSNE